MSGCEACSIRASYPPGGDMFKPSLPGGYFGCFTYLSRPSTSSGGRSGRGQELACQAVGYAPGVRTPRCRRRPARRGGPGAGDGGADCHPLRGHTHRLVPGGQGPRPLCQALQDARQELAARPDAASRRRHRGVGPRLAPRRRGVPRAPGRDPPRPGRAHGGLSAARPGLTGCRAQVSPGARRKGQPLFAGNPAVRPPSPSASVEARTAPDPTPSEWPGSCSRSPTRPA